MFSIINLAENQTKSVATEERSLRANYNAFRKFRMADKHGKAATPLGLVVIGGFTQPRRPSGLGSGAESLWDSGSEFPKGISPN
jgi:hypothetical protein